MNVANRTALGELAGGAGFANIDLALEVGELDFRAAAIDGAVDGLIDLDAVLAAFSLKRSTR